MTITELEQIVSGVSHESIKHWLKISGLRHTAANRGEFFKLLQKLISDGELDVEHLRRVVIEVEEYGKKRIHLGNLRDFGLLRSRAKFEKHLGSLGLELDDAPIRARKKPSAPHLNYIWWSAEEVRVSYSETHEFLRISRVREVVERIAVTNLIVIAAEPNTGFVKLFMNAPGDRNPHQATYGIRGIEGYEPFYKNKALELFGASEFNPIDLSKVAEGIVKTRPMMFEPTDFNVRTSHNSKHRIWSRSDITTDPVFVAGDEADGDKWVHENVSGYWLPDASGGKLHRKMYMHLSMREDMVQFPADNLASEVEYAISRIRAI